MPSGYSAVPPQPCQMCGKTMRSPNELKEATFTGVCDVCTGAEPNVVGIELVDGARLWSTPPVAGSGSRQRRITVGYPDCAGCMGKGCQACVDRRNSDPVRKWVAGREQRISAATQAVYERLLKREGILEQAQANSAPQKKLRKAVIPLLKRVEAIKDKWSRIVRSRLRFVNR